MYLLSIYNFITYKDYDSAVWKSLRTLVKLQTNKKCRSDYKAEYVFDLIVAGFQMNISWKGEGKDRCNMWSCMNVILKLCFGVAGADRFQLLWGFTQPVNSTIWLYIRYVSDFWVRRVESDDTFRLWTFCPFSLTKKCSSARHLYFVTLVNINKKYESIACNIVVCAYQIVSVWMTFRWI